MVDYHMHLQSEYYDNIEDVINNCLANNVKYIVTSGYDLNSSLEAIRLANTYSFVYASIGISPQCIEDFNEENLKIIEENLSNPKVLFVGEIGLDYYYGRQNEKEQKEKFIQQLDLAVKYNLPVIIHNRNATDDIYNILKLYKGKLRGIIHCFSGSIETANMFIKLGFLLGIGGIVTFKNNDNLRTVLKHVALDNIVLETDSPYLTPVPFRKNHNEPKYIIETAKVLACIYNMDLLDIGKITSSNALNLFKLNS